MTFRHSSGTVASFVAGALGLSAAGVASADPLPVPAADAFFISGSTAMDNPVRGLLTSASAQAICANEAGGIDVYTDATQNDSTSGHQFFVVCKLRAAIGTIAANTVVAIGKESNGGSFEGTKPIAENTQLTFIDPTHAPACTTVTAAGAGAPAFPGGQAYTHHYGCPVVVSPNSFVPQIGVADENLEVFNIGSPVVTAADIKAITAIQWAQNPFGIAVSLNLYRALQRQQGLNPASDAIAAMPSMSSQTIRAIYQGNLTSWAGVTNAAGVAINNAANLGGEPAVPNQIYLCRRGIASGTNASVDIHFLGQRCTAGSNPMTPATVAACTQPGCAWVRATNITDTVFAGFAGGDVQKCLNDHDRIDQFAIGNSATNGKFGDAGGTGGSLDPDSAASTNTHFRFVRIDGKSPDNGSVVNGSYDYVFDNIINVKSTAPAEVTALRDTMLNDYVVNFGILQAEMLTQVGGDANWTAGVLLDQNQPTVLANGAPLPNTQPAYVTGAAVKSGAGGVTPVTPWTFLLINGNNPQNCAPPAAIPNTGFPVTP